MTQDHGVRVMINKILYEQEKRTLEKQQEKIYLRQEANRELIENLTAYVEKYPDLRFGQILEIFGFVIKDINLYNEESVDTLERVRKVVYETE